MSADQVLHESHTFQIVKSSNPRGLRLYGSIDIAARSALEHELKEALREGADLYVDLSGVEFIDVGGMRALMDAAAYLSVDGWRLYMVGPNLTVRRIIRICQATAPRDVMILPA
jgi:anti-anti-sigma factor